MLRILAALALLTQPAGGPALRSAAPAPPAAAVPAPGQGHVTFTAPPAAQRRWVSYEGRDEILFRMIVAGRETWALLDTGAGLSLIDTGLARAAGLALQASSTTAQTPTGQIATQLTRDVDLIIPDHLNMHMTHTVGADLSHVSASVGRPVGFILGWEIIGTLALVVDTDNHRFYIAQPAEVRVPANFPSIPFSRATRQLSARVGDQMLTLELDTGHNGVIGLRQEAWDRVAPPGAKTTPGSARQAQGDLEPIRLGTLPLITIGPATLRDVPTSVRQLGNTHADGIIGMGLFRHLGFVLDAPEGRLWLLPPGAAAPAGGTTAPAPSAPVVPSGAQNGH